MAVKTECVSVQTAVCASCLRTVLQQLSERMSRYLYVSKCFVIYVCCHSEAGLSYDCWSNSIVLLLGNYRLLLRREQVHKVACNHLLTAEIKLQPLQTSETTWCWFAMDYSEDEPAMQNFACRFKVCVVDIKLVYLYMSKYCVCFQCFDAVGCAAGRASGL